AAEGVVGATVTLWGVPAESSHDQERYCPGVGQINEQRERDDGKQCTSGAPLVPFLTNPTSCSGELTSVLALDSWQDPGVFAKASTGMPGITGCEKPNFNPTVVVEPESTSTDVSTGLK